MVIRKTVSLVLAAILLIPDGPAIARTLRSVSPGMRAGWSGPLAPGAPQFLPSRNQSNPQNVFRSAEFGGLSEARLQPEVRLERKGEAETVSSAVQLGSSLSSASQRRSGSVGATRQVLSGFFDRWGKKDGSGVLAEAAPASLNHVAAQKEAPKRQRVVSKPAAPSTTLFADPEESPTPNLLKGAPATLMLSSLALLTVLFFVQAVTGAEVTFGARDFIHSVLLGDYEAFPQHVFDMVMMNFSHSDGGHFFQNLLLFFALALVIERVAGRKALMVALAVGFAYHPVALIMNEFFLWDHLSSWGDAIATKAGLAEAHTLQVHGASALVFTLAGFYYAQYLKGVYGGNRFWRWTAFGVLGVFTALAAMSPGVLASLGSVQGFGALSLYLVVMVAMGFLLGKLIVGDEKTKLPDLSKAFFISIAFLAALALAFNVAYTGMTWFLAPEMATASPVSYASHAFPGIGGLIAGLKFSSASQASSAQK